MKTLNILLEITIYSGVLFCSIMLLKLRFKNRLSPFLHFAVWGLLIARLLIPVTLESSVRLFVIPTQNETAAEQIQSSVINPDTTANTNPCDAAQSQPQTSGRQARAAATVSDNALKIRRVRTLPAEKIILAVWITGAGVGLLYLTVLYGVLRERIRRNTAPPSQRLLELFHEVRTELRIKRDVRILCQWEYGAPAMLFPKTVLMPIDTLVSMNDEQVKLMLRHELMHFRRGDHILGLLLSLLNAVYWFNPIVWIAFKQIRADMETACDSDVVRHFSSDEKITYAAIILSLFSKKQYGHLVLGMVQGKTKQIAEKRIKGVFMQPKTNKKIRAAAFLLMAVLLFTCFTTACQPTPEQNVIVGKNEGNLEELINQSPAPVRTGESIREALDIPDLWSETFENQNGKVSFAINAPIDLPETEKVPVAVIVPAAFTQEQADNMLQVLLGGADLYEPLGMTREQILNEIVDTKALIAEAEREEDTQVNKDWIAQLQATIEYYEDMYNNTPESLPKIPAESTLGPSYSPFFSGGGEIGLDVMADTAAGSMRFVMTNGENFSAARVIKPTADGLSFKDYRYNNVSEALDRPKGVEMSREEAQQKAREIAGALDAGLELAYTGVVATTSDPIYQDWVWQMVFTRTVNGFATPYETHEHGGDISIDMTEPIVPYERMFISINDSGLAQFEWVNPMRVEQIANENVKILPFKELQERAKAALLQSFNALSEGYGDRITHTSVHVNYVTLGLARIKDKDSQGQYKLVPVWDLYGIWNNTPKDPSEESKMRPVQDPSSYSYRSMLTINAIDGSIIDRNLGY
jgi:beta-lactamase regulating signal transducer with metallopeptidase domain